MWALFCPLSGGIEWRGDQGYPSLGERLEGGEGMDGRMEAGREVRRSLVKRGAAVMRDA